MANDDQSQQPPRYWFPYWSGVPQPPPPSRPSRPPVRPQLSRRLSPPSPAAAPSSPRRPSPSQNRQQPTTTTAPTRGAAPPSPPQSQVSRPSPSRSSPLVPIREPPAAPPSNNSNASGAVSPEPAKPPARPVVLLLPAVPEAAPRQKDVDVVFPRVKPVAQVQQPAASELKPHGGHSKAADKEHKTHHQKEEEKKDEHKTKEKEKKEETKSKEKEKEKEKEKKHHAGEDAKHKEVKAEHGKLHREIKAGVADMVHKASGSGHAAGSGTSVITLAGENKGASMKVGGGNSKNGGEWHGHGYRLDGGSGSDGKKVAGKPGMMTALINSNVQVINNSLLLQSSCNGGDPGVHLKLSAKSASKEKQKHAPGGDKVAAASAGKK
ncbi:hypothetical protein ACQ4PT_022487 [Festuca glaucescens]